MNELDMAIVEICGRESGDIEPVNSIARTLKFAMADGGDSEREVRIIGVRYRDVGCTQYDRSALRNSDTSVRYTWRIVHADERRIQRFVNGIGSRSTIELNGDDDFIAGLKKSEAGHIITHRPGRRVDTNERRKIDVGRRIRWADGRTHHTTARHVWDGHIIKRGVVPSGSVIVT